MPRVKLTVRGEKSAWALWRIEESEPELAFLALETCPSEMIAPHKRLEYLAGRSLIRDLVEQFNDPYNGLRKDNHGKPFLKDLNSEISLSHSYPYVAAQIHPTISVGIDIEQPKEKLLKIASRVLSKDEEIDAGDQIDKHCIYWCAKEAMYKIHGKRGLHFSHQLNLDPFEMMHEGSLKGRITVRDFSQEVSLGYLVEPDYVLVYTEP